MAVLQGVQFVFDYTTLGAALQAPSFDV